MNMQTKQARILAKFKPIPSFLLSTTGRWIYGRIGVQEKESSTMSVETESIDLTLNGHLAAPSDGSLGYVITLSASFSGYSPVAGDKLLVSVSTSSNDSFANQRYAI